MARTVRFRLNECYTDTRQSGPGCSVPARVTSWLLRPRCDVPRVFARPRGPHHLPDPRHLLRPNVRLPSQGSTASDRPPIWMHTPQFGQSCQQLRVSSVVIAALPLWAIHRQPPATHP